MADVSQLEINGTTYDICDATARDSLSQYLPLSGGTITGDLTANSIIYCNQLKSLGAMNFSQSSSTNYYWIGADGGSYAYLICVDSDAGTGIQYRFPATSQSTAPGIQFRNYENGTWGGWTSWIYNSQTSRTANTVLAAPNGSDGKATFRALVPDDVSWIGERTQIVSSGADKTIATGTWTDLGTFTVTAGRKYIATFHTEWNAHSDGAVSHAANSTVAAPNNDTTTSYVTSGAANNIERLTSTTLYAPTSTATYHFICYQGTGANLTLRGHSAYIMRIA